MSPTIEKVEKYFKIPFADVINILHIKEKRPMIELATMCNVSRIAMSDNAKKLGLKTMSPKEAALVKRGGKGEDHWAYGIKRPEQSIRMKKNNPSKDNKTLIKMAISKANFLKENPLLAEELCSDLLEKHNVDFIFQYPINRYVIDFFIPSANLCIEIESMDKWGKYKRQRAATKRAFLENLGYSVENVARKKLSNNLIINILNTYNII